MPENETDYPLSCCSEFVVTDDGEHCKHPYGMGCYNRIGVIINRSALYIGTAALAITLVQVKLSFSFIPTYFKQKKTIQNQSSKLNG